MAHHIVSPTWVTEGYSFPTGTKVSWGDDLADVPLGVMADADFFVLPYDGSSIDLATAIARMDNVKVLQTLTAGFDNIIDLVPKGVTLCNAGNVHDVSTADMALVLLLSSYRDMPQTIRAQDKHEWVHYISRSLWQKKIVLIGYGGVGKATEQRLKGFDCEVTPIATFERDHVRTLDALPELLPNADVVVLTVPLNAKTYHLVDATFLGQMKDGALLVNVARGPVVDTEALLPHLQSGRLHAALDVTDPEPLPADHPLWSAPNTVIAPHLGGDTDVFERRARAMAHAQFDRLFAGAPLEHVIVRD